MKAIPSISPAHREEVRRLISMLESDPIPHRSYDVVKLEGVRDAFRVRIGGMRLVYVVDWVSSIITITRIEARGRAYKGL